MSQSHQRRTSLKGTPQASFYIDVEKDGHDVSDLTKEEAEIAEDDGKDHRLSLTQLLSMILLWFLFLLVEYKFGLLVRLGRGGGMDISNPILNINANAKDETFLNLWDDSLLDDKSLEAIATITPEDEEIHTMKSQLDLKEIFSVSPIILISNDPDSSDQKKLETIVQNLNIHPEPKIVSLDKHPNCNNILKYLKSYKSHQDKDTVAASSTPAGSIKSDLKFNHQELLDSPSDSEPDEDAGANIDYEKLRYISEKRQADRDSLYDIPRLFIGGVPQGNYDDVFKMNSDKSLSSFIREKGKGLITLG